jgi:hypothetical protein
VCRVSCAETNTRLPLSSIGYFSSSRRVAAVAMCDVASTAFHTASPKN